MNISLKGWIQSVKEDFIELEKTINIIREDYKGYIFDQLQEDKQIAGKRAIGFLEDMNNIFADLNEFKTDEEKVKWVDHIKEFLDTAELEYKKTERTLINKSDEGTTKETDEIQEKDFEEKVDEIEDLICARRLCMADEARVDGKPVLEVSGLPITERQNIHDELKSTILNFYKKKISELERKIKEIQF